MSPTVVALTCLAVVMSVMTLLVGVLYALRAISTRLATAPEPALPEGEVPPEILAVLAAAVHAALGKAAVIHRIHLRTPGQENWSRVGRIDILRSHRMDQKR